MRAQSDGVRKVTLPDWALPENVNYAVKHW